MDEDVDFDLNLDALFSAFDDSNQRNGEYGLPPVPLPLPNSKLSKRSVASVGDESMFTELESADLSLNDPSSQSFFKDLQEIKETSLFLGGTHDGQVQVLDEFQTTTEKVYPIDAAVLPITPTSEKLPSSTPAAATHAVPHPPASADTDVELKFSKSNIATRHEVVLPPNFDKSTYVPIKNYKPPEVWARTYPFTLDPFQEYSIYCIQRNESVLVAAHTSAGKTVVAEYAIAQALKNKQRVIYTSPIKALSNQKYRELLEDFADVGLMTGDVTISPRASCLVMTTEILRSMLYRGSEILREISWVVYDEIHYMRDKERGVVWEETLILLPPTVHFVFLSATIPNAKQFAQWICRIHKQPCHVVYTDFRPTPLQHFLFPANSAGIHLVVDEKGNFREENFQKAMSSLATSEDVVVGPKKKKGKHGVEKSDIFKVIKMIMQRDYHPVIIFSFSKKECEAHAIEISKLDLNDDAQKELVVTVFNNAIKQLNEDDQKLPQITGMLPLLQRGIGVHHSGLLPILKETIEILFQEGTIKVLFATETFSIGLNMPAKTVVFTRIEKFDGKESRYLTGGEYIQMSGRAGRRGLDDKGIVIMMMDQKIDVEKAKSMVKGEANPLVSAFRLGYNMLLNLIRVEGVTPEYLIQNSFRQFQSHSSLPLLLESVEEYEKFYADMEIEDEDIIRSYYISRYRLDQFTQSFRDVITDPLYALPFLQDGRLVQIMVNGVDFGWAVIVNVIRRQRGQYGVDKENAQHMVLDVALLVDRATRSENRIESLRPPPNDRSAELVVVPVLLSTVAAISSIRLHTQGWNLKFSDGRKTAQRALTETVQRVTKVHEKVPTLDPVTDMKIESKRFKEVVQKMQHYEALLRQHPWASQPELLKQRYNQYVEKIKLCEKIKALRTEIKKSQALLQHDELKARKRVLRRLGFTNEDDIVQLKGRVACEISTGDPLLLTEMLFHGVFTELTVEQCVALLGVFTFLDRAKDTAQKQTLREELANPLQVLLEIAKRIAHVSKECQLDLDEAEYLDSFRPDLMEVVFAWASGAKFSQICKMTDVFEGNLVRSFRLLEEMLRQMTNAAKAIGNQDLEIKFTQGITKIKRDIIFANSLYL